MRGEPVCICISAHTPGLVCVFSRTLVGCFGFSPKNFSPLQPNVRQFLRFHRNVHGIPLRFSSCFSILCFVVLSQVRFRFFLSIYMIFAMFQRKALLRRVCALHGMPSPMGRARAFFASARGTERVTLLRRALQPSYSNSRCVGLLVYIFKMVQKSPKSETFAPCWRLAIFERVLFFVLVSFGDPRENVEK